MRLERLQLRGYSTAFPGMIDLPLGDLDAGLVAVTGPNGAGKTTLLEAAPAVLYRKLPARNGDDPVDYATTRESHIGLEFVVDAYGPMRYAALLNLDGQKRQTDAVLQVQQEDGTWRPINNGQRSTFDQAIAGRFPSFDLFINSVFAAQGRGDEFTRRKPSARKDLFTEFLSLGHLLAMSDTAGQAERVVVAALTRLEAEIAALERTATEAQLQALDELRVQTIGARDAAQARQRELATEIARLEAQEKTAGDQIAAYATAQHAASMASAAVSDKRRGIERAERQAAEETKRHQEQIRVIAERVEATRTDVETRIAGNQKLQNRADEIRAAVATVAAIDAELDDLRPAHAEVGRLFTDLRAQHADADRAIAKLTGPQQALERARTDSRLLTTVPCHGVGEYAACELLQTAQAAAGKVEALERELAALKGLEATRQATEDALRTADAEHARLAAAIVAREAARRQQKAVADYLPSLDASDAKIASYRDQLARAEQDATEQRNTAIVIYSARVTAQEAHAALLARELAALERNAQAAQEALDAAGQEHGQARAIQDALRAARTAWDVAVGDLARATSGLEELARRRIALESTREQIATLQDRHARLQTERLEWADLAKALGKGGLPDLEIDAAGPSISALTNELLTACFGPRFSLELVTQVATADGKGTKDLFTVQVTDNESGQVRDIGQLSGGEKTIVQEALMSAIALYVNERSPMPIRTLWRDETGAALDPANAIKYVAMLRRVREIGRFEKVLFISHNPEASALADAQIQVGGGRAEIVLPPYSDEAAA